MHRRPALTRDEFQHRWLTEHADIVLSRPATHTFVGRYAQLHTFDTTQNDHDRAAMDVVEVFGFASLNDVEDFSPFPTSSRSPSTGGPSPGTTRGSTGPA